MPGTCSVEKVTKQNKTSNKVWFNVAFITQRFLTQVNNHFPISVDLLCRKEDQLSRVTTIQPDSVFSVPLILAHKAALYLRPAGFGFVYLLWSVLWQWQLRSVHWYFIRIIFLGLCPIGVREYRDSCFVARCYCYETAIRSNFARFYVTSILQLPF